MFGNLRNSNSFGPNNLYIQLIKANDHLSLEKEIDEDICKSSIFSIDEVNNISTQNERGDNFVNDRITLLHIAAYYDSLECFVFLNLEIGIPIRSLSVHNFYALHYACYHGSKEVAAYILENDPTILKEVINNSFLCFAINDYGHSILEALFEKGATQKTPIGNLDDPLHKAISTDNFKCCEILIKHTDLYRKGTSPAIIAASNSNPRLVDYFVKGSYDLMFDKQIHKSVFTQIFDITNGEIYIPYIKKWLSDYDVEIEPPQEEENRKGVCHWVCKLADKEVAELMLNTKNININRLDASNHLGTYNLAVNDDLSDQTIIDILDLLIDHQFDINFQPENGFCEPVLKGFLKTIKIRYPVIEYLFEHGALVNLPWTQKVMKSDNKKDDEENTILNEIKRKRKDAKLMEIFLKYFPDYYDIIYDKK